MGQPQEGRRWRYSDEERAIALAALAANGGNRQRTARQLGIPRKTLATWASGAVQVEGRFESGGRPAVD